MLNHVECSLFRQEGQIMLNIRYLDKKVKSCWIFAIKTRRSNHVDYSLFRQEGQNMLNIRYLDKKVKSCWIFAI